MTVLDNLYQENCSTVDDRRQYHEPRVKVPRILRKKGTSQSLQNYMLYMQFCSMSILNNAFNKKSFQNFSAVWRFLAGLPCLSQVHAFKLFRFACNKICLYVCPELLWVLHLVYLFLNLYWTFDVIAMISSWSFII